MTISNTEFEITVSGNGLTTTFSFDFNMVLASYARLIFTDSEGTTASITSSDYTLTGVGNTDGGTFTYPLVGSPITAGESLTLQRILPLTQDVSIANQGNFYPSAVEQGLDNLTMITQQIQGQVDSLEEVQGVTSVGTGTGLEGGPITQSGTISISTGGVTTSLIGDNAVTYAKMQTVSNGRFLGNFSGASAVPQEIQFIAGTGVTIGTATGSVTITSSGSGGTVTSVDTGVGLTGGPITTTGSIAIATDGVTTGALLNSAVTYAKVQNVTNQRFLGNFSGGAAAPQEIQFVAGTNITITPATGSITISASGGGGSGTVTSITAGTGLSGGTITDSGTIAIAAIADQRLFGNYSGGSLAPQAIQLVAGSGITFSGTTTSLTITASGGAATSVGNFATYSGYGSMVYCGSNISAATGAEAATVFDTQSYNDAVQPPDSGGTQRFWLGANKTMTVASTTSDTLTITGHGLTTGEGPILFSNSGGALPSPLTNTTKYWAGVVDPNTISLYPTRADSLASTNKVDLTTTGSGTQTMVSGSKLVVPSGVTRIIFTGGYSDNGSGVNINVTIWKDGSATYAGKARVDQGNGGTGGSIIVSPVLSVAGGEYFEMGNFAGSATSLLAQLTWASIFVVK